MGLKGIFKNSCIILCSEVKAIFALFSLGKQAELVGKRTLMGITFSLPIHNENAYFVFFHEMVSQVQPQQETQKGLRKTKLVIFTVLRDRMHSTTHRATQDGQQGGGQEVADRSVGEVLTNSLYWHFWQKGKTRQNKHFRIGQCE